MSPSDALASGIVGIIIAVLGYAGVRHQAKTAKAGSDATARAAETRDLLDGWRELFEAHRSEIESLRAAEQASRTEQERVRDDLAGLHGEINSLRSELARWQSVARTIARWAVTMRDQLRGLGQEVPAEPDELMTLRIVSEVATDPAQQIKPRPTGGTP